MILKFDKWFYNGLHGERAGKWANNFIGRVFFFGWLGSGLASSTNTATDPDMRRIELDKIALLYCFFTAADLDTELGKIRRWRLWQTAKINRNLIDRFPCFFVAHCGCSNSVFASIISNPITDILSRFFLRVQSRFCISDEEFLIPSPFPASIIIPTPAPTECIVCTTGCDDTSRGAKLALQDPIGRN